MKLHEYQARSILQKYGIPVPAGDVATSPEEARSVAERLGGRTVIKAQVLLGGRGKAGGVRLSGTSAEAAEAARAILGMSIKGIAVEKVLVALAIDIARELYLGIVVDRANRAIALMASAEGGVEIEELARTRPERIAKVTAHPLLGLLDYQARDLAFGIGLEGNLLRDFTNIAKALYRAFVECDASLAEINPLAILPQGSLVAADAKIVLDDNALFRHKDLEAQRDPAEEQPAERIARENGFSFVKLDGTIGCMVNGAGLAMATMDVIKLYGGMPANFLDIGGGARADRVEAALRLILADSNVKAVLLNIFGGITRCDEVARGILTALSGVSSEVPIIVRLVGTNEQEGRDLLAQAGLVATTNMDEAAKIAVGANN
ncbi:MAG: ADP-forming succinate--CoA ligase subunit beta [Chloroflexi bacterium]|nr:ADP-forming succinate--CoA ligase subunit beta [Chloroflexota bacterium]